MNFNYLALGDSYTVGECVNERDRWPIQLSKLLEEVNGVGVNTTILATTGWRTDNLTNALNIARLKDEYDLVSLSIGVNNQYQHRSLNQYTVEFEELLKISCRLAKGKKENVFVLSIPDYGFTPYGSKNKDKISKEIDQFNAVSKQLSDVYQIQYVDITAISRAGLQDPALIASDGLHPSGKMYALWVNHIISKIILR